MQNEDSTSNDVLQFPDENNLLSTISGNRDTQPTKTKVTAFKARVLKLLLIYAEKSNDLAPLFKAINQQSFLKQPEKIHTIVTQGLNRPNISENALMELLNMYKILLLFKVKSKDKSQLFCEVFIRILKKLGEPGYKVIDEMLEIAITKRNCVLNINFFFFLARKIPQCKKSILQKCKNLSKETKVRPAQQKQLQKIGNKLQKKQQVVKKQEIV